MEKTVYLFCMPRQVGLRLKKIQRDFLWGGGALMQKPHLVRWKTVYSERKNGERGEGWVLGVSLR